MSKIIKKEGMYGAGDLIITFEIIMPSKLSTEYKKYLKKLLPVAQPKDIDGFERKDYYDYNIKETKYEHEEHYEEDNMGNEQIQCNQQ